VRDTDDDTLFSSLTNSVGTTGADLTVENMLAAQEAYKARRDAFEDNYTRVMNQTVECVMSARGLSREDAARWMEQRIADEIALAAARIAMRPRLRLGHKRTRRLWRRRGRR
jgi:hypothetical protein